MADKSTVGHRKRASGPRGPNGNADNGKAISIDVEAFRKLGAPAAEGTTDPDTGIATRTDAGADTGAQPSFLSDAPAEPQATVSVPQPPKSEAARRHRRTQEEIKAADKTAAPKQATETLINVAELLGTAIGGPAMKPEQKQLIREGLPELMARMTPAALEQTQGILYPALVILGFGSYGLEVWQAVSARQAAEHAAKMNPIVPSSPEAAAEQKAPEPKAPMVMPLPSISYQPAAPEMATADVTVIPPAAVLDDLKSHDGREFISPRSVV